MINKSIEYNFNCEIKNVKAIVLDVISSPYQFRRGETAITKYLVQNESLEINGKLVQVIDPTEITKVN